MTAIPQARPVAAAPVVFALLGAYTALLQVVVLRESFMLSAGNELVVAVQMSVWLGLTAIGGGLGATLPAGATPPLLAALPLAGLWAVGCVRLLPLLWPAPLGMDPGPGRAALALVVALTPLNLAAGSLFPAACRFFASQGEAPAIGRWYTLEALGGAAAGAAFTFLFAGRVRGVSLAVWGSAAAAGVAVFALGRCAPRLRKAAFGLSLAMVAVALFGQPTERLDDLEWRHRRPGSRPGLTIESPYQRLDLAVAGEARTVYSNGVPAFSLDDTDEAGTGYRAADLFLALHPCPRRVLILGDGEPGLTRRVLEYPLDRVVCVLTDPALLDVVGRPSGRAPVEFAAVDGRRFLRDTPERFDLVILHRPLPASAAANRFFTAEAFAEARDRLLPEGRLVLALPSSAHYLAGDAERLLASILRALEHAFGTDKVRLIAGDSMVFVAGSEAPTPSLEALARRFAERGAPLSLAGGQVQDRAGREAAFRALHGPQFEPLRQQTQEVHLRAGSVPPNRDAQPIAYYMNLRRWVAETGASASAADRFFRRAESVVAKLRSAWLLATVVAALGWGQTLLAFCRRGGPACHVARRGAIAFGVLVSGWAGMTGELAIVYVFQSAVGRLYQAVGALFATYMLGLVVGSALAKPDRGSARRRAVKLALARVGMIAVGLLAMALAGRAQASLYFVALFAYALAMGYEYPLANAIYLGDEGGRTAAGVLHAADHFGAALAALLGGALLLPLIGPVATLGLAVCLHVVALTGLGALFHGEQHADDRCPTS